MAMIVDAFVGEFLKKLTDLIQDRVVMMLEVGEELQRLKASLEMVVCVLKEAERKRIEDIAINSWLNDLKDIMYDADDIIDELCRPDHDGGSPPHLEGRSKVRFCLPLRSCLGISTTTGTSSSSMSIPFRYRIGTEIRSLNTRLEALRHGDLRLQLVAVNPKASPSVIDRKTSPIVEPDIVGANIHDDTTRLVEMLNDHTEQGCRVFAITGMGGIGKTTLAQNIFNDPSIKGKHEITIWLCVSQNFSEIDLLKQMIREAGKDHGHAAEKAELAPMLRKAVEGKSMFLVLDDVWQADHVWNNLLRTPLSGGAAIRRVVVTTRDENVAKKMGAEHIHRVNLLSDDQGWELLCRSSLLQGEGEIQSLKDLGCQIVKKCKGLPLAIKTVGGLLRTKEKSPREWEKVLKNSAWNLSKLPEDLRGALYLSYEDLPSHLKQCFLYFALFREDFILYSEKLVRYWVAEGFVEKDGDNMLEETAIEYYEELIRRCIIQPFGLSSDAVSHCTMHDLLRSLAVFLAEYECFYGDEGEIKLSAKQKLRRLSLRAKEQPSDVVIPEFVLEQNCLRTLMSPTRIQNDSFVRLQHLRVLDLGGMEMEIIPDSIGNLIHLRYLDLSGTRISKLPETILRLSNLQVLLLASCMNLASLPHCITRLHNLRCLDISETRLEHLPRGICQLQQLNELVGFVISDQVQDDVGENVQARGLEELKSLKLVRHLQIEKLERAMQKLEKITNVTNVLSDKTHLRQLGLRCTKREVEEPYSEEEMIQIEQLFSNLCPPPCLDQLYIFNYFGRVHPSWMRSSYLGTRLPYLTYLNLVNYASCLQLPPLGELPNLQNLCIECANAVVSIGSEFLGNGARDIGNHYETSIAFPKLKVLEIRDMPKWEEWSLHREGEEVDFDDSRATSTLNHLSLLPHLEELFIFDCPKLRSLPPNLDQATQMNQLEIHWANELKAIENLPNLSGLLVVGNNPSLEKISNLPAVERLSLVECPSVRCVENLDVLKFLNMEDEGMERLPQWLLPLALLRQNHHNNIFSVIAKSKNVGVVERCREGGEDWHIVQQIFHILVYADTEKERFHVLHRKKPFYYDTNFSVPL
ncbi:disease resistance protein RGA4 [Canna indica]|uniref:Disease resistance protein RGA4 n=1 Tax=Canna indica TaxID=4628 RepID=A0AAQ3Q837_9LILI|nr:disease resistance protein RGA4 [Canna indica]